MFFFHYRSKQSSLEDFFHKKNKKPCTPQEASMFTNSIISMIVKDMRPLATVEGKGFREMVNTFHSGYTYPSRCHFTDLMEKKYVATMAKVKSELKKAPPNYHSVLMLGQVLPLRHT